MESNKYYIAGTGLLALDVILNGNPSTPPKVSAGGSCGNVLTILSFLGNESFPISRLANNNITEILIEELSQWKVNTSLISVNENGNTPIIIHRILKEKSGKPKHRFEFKNPFTGKWLPSYKPILAKNVDNIKNKVIFSPHAFYFDRINRGSIELAKKFKENGALIIFEPSSIKDIKQFNECLEVSDILKFSHERIANYAELFPHIQVPLEIETLGEDGLKFRFLKDKWKKLQAPNITGVIDSAGSGDWCTSGIINYLLAKEGKIFDFHVGDVEQALNYGQALGAINCFFEGARGAMNYLDHISLNALVEDILERKVPLGLPDVKRITDNKEISLEVLFDVT